MVIKHFTFVADDPYLASARPGSPHPFFSTKAAASPSPDVCSNCCRGRTSATHHRNSSALVQDKRVRAEAEEDYNDEDGVVGLGPAVLSFWRRINGRGRPQSRFIRTQGEDVKFGQIKVFSLQELRVATKNFSRKNFWISSKWGKLYEGCLADGSMVMVRRLEVKKDCSQGREQQLFQIELLVSHLADHLNLLKIHGFCTTGAERLLVYPCMPNGSVASYLKEENVGWPIRKLIALGAARGLRCLHDQCKIIHGNVCISNIFLDRNFEPVLGNFGLAKLMDHTEADTTTSDRCMYDYIAPEYLCELSEKRDVFYYGKMLLKLVIGQDEGSGYIGEIIGEDDLSWINWIKGLIKLRRLNVLVNYNIRGSEDEVEQLIQVSMMCTRDDPAERPRMSEVVKMLEGEGLTERCK